MEQLVEIVNQINQYNQNNWNLVKSAYKDTLPIDAILYNHDSEMKNRKMAVGDLSSKELEDAKTFLDSYFSDKLNKKKCP